MILSRSTAEVIEVQSVATRDSWVTLLLRLSEPLAARLQQYGPLVGLLEAALIRWAEDLPVLSAPPSTSADAGWQFATQLRLASAPLQRLAGPESAEVAQ